MSRVYIGLGCILLTLGIFCILEDKSDAKIIGALIMATLSFILSDLEEIKRKLNIIG